MGRFAPCVVVALHDVAIRTCGGGVGHGRRIVGAMKSVRSDSTCGTNDAPQHRAAHPQRGPFFRRLVLVFTRLANKKRRLAALSSERSWVDPQVLVSQR